MLRSILRRKCAAFCAALQSPLEMLFGRLEIMLPSDLLAVAHPFANDVRRELLFKFRLPARPQVVEDARPRFHAGSLHKPCHVCAEIRSWVTISRDEVLRSGWGRVEHRFQIGAQFGEQRDDSRFMARVSLGLGARDMHSTMLPVYIDQHKGQMLRRTAKPTISAQRNYQSPFRVSGLIKHFSRCVATDEVLTQLIANR